MAIHTYQTALVTGASSGIGAAITRQLTARSVRVIATARRAERLDTLAKATGATPLILDLTDTDAIYAALEDLEVDVLINNAGLAKGFGTSFLDLDPEDIEVTAQVNTIGFAHVVRAIVPGMAARRRGHVVTIGSVAGFYPLSSPIYGATKAGVHQFSQNLRVTLRGTGVRVTEIAPGRVATEFFEVGPTDDRIRARFRNSRITVLTADDIAQTIVFALEAPLHVNVSLLEVTPTEQAFGGVYVDPMKAPEDAA